MTLRRLLELIEAEKNGYQIVRRQVGSGYFNSNKHTCNIKFLDEELGNILKDYETNCDEYNNYYIKDLENEYGEKNE